MDITNVRPVPPRVLDECLKVGDRVDAYYHNRWQRGTVMNILANSKFVVEVDDESDWIVIDQCNLRGRRGFTDDGSWRPPLFRKRKASDLEFKRKRAKLNTYDQKEFAKRMMVEVRSDEAGYEGAWYGAAVVDSVGNDKFVVEYLNLVTDDETAPLRVVAVSKDIRPVPPEVPCAGSFELYDKVDVWFNEGWWEGVVSKVLTGSKYMVYFSTTRENLEFDQSQLRFHQEWINRKWIKAEEIVVTMNGSNSQEVFSKGTKVEIRSDEFGFQGAWFAARIVKAMSKDTYLVRYGNILTVDRSIFLIEEANVRNIRPAPPDIVRAYPYERSELVDAWYNDAWWLGRVTTVVKAAQMKSKYQVRLKTGEILEFVHQDVRPHREWIDGSYKARDV